MAKIKITFTDEQIKLIKCMRFKELSETTYGLDSYSLWGGNYLYEQIALILGYADRVIPGTEEDWDGPKYPTELMEKFIELDEFILKNLVSIEDILHQFCDKGGIQAGVTYVSYDYEGIWHTEDEWKNVLKRH